MITETGVCLNVLNGLKMVGRAKIFFNFELIITPFVSICRLILLKYRLYETLSVFKLMYTCL